MHHSWVRRASMIGRVSWLVRTSDSFIRTNDAFVRTSESLMRMSASFVRMKDALLRGKGRMCERLAAGGRRRRSPEEVRSVRCTGSPFWKAGLSLPGLLFDCVFWRNCVFFWVTVFKYFVFKWAAMFTKSTTFENSGARVELDGDRTFPILVAPGNRKGRLDGGPFLFYPLFIGYQVWR
jgi:hypothetical protein